MSGFELSFIETFLQNADVIIGCDLKTESTYAIFIPRSVLKVQPTDYSNMPHVAVSIAKDLHCDKRCRG
jgi:hypothetical protein